MEQNDVMENLDFQLEKKYEMERETRSYLVCDLCGEHISLNQKIIQQHDGTLVHLDCIVQKVKEEAFDAEDFM